MKIIKLEDGKKYGWSAEPALYYGINLGLGHSLYAFSMMVENSFTFNIKLPYPDTDPVWEDYFPSDNGNAVKYSETYGEFYYENY